MLAEQFRQSCVTMATMRTLPVLESVGAMSRQCPRGYRRMWLLLSVLRPSATTHEPLHKIYLTEETKKLMFLEKKCGKSYKSAQFAICACWKEVQKKVHGWHISD